MSPPHWLLTKGQISQGSPIRRISVNAHFLSLKCSLTLCLPTGCILFCGRESTSEQLRGSRTLSQSSHLRRPSKIPYLLSSWHAIIPTSQESYPGLTDSFLTHRIRQKPCDINSKFRLYKNCGSHFEWSLTLPLISCPRGSQGSR